MKSGFMMLGLAVLLSAGLSNSRYVLAEDTMTNTESNQSTGTDQKDSPSVSKAVEVGNKICPVSGEKIPPAGQKSDMGETVKFEYNGKVYNLCCPMCIKDFKKDPEKYSKIAEQEAAQEKTAGQN